MRFEDKKLRDKILKKLIEKGIDAKIHYPTSMHLQPAAKIYGYKKGDFPVSEYQAKHLLTIPVHQFINREQIHYIINKIKEFYK